MDGSGSPARCCGSAGLQPVRPAGFQTCGVARGRVAELQAGRIERILLRAFPAERFRSRRMGVIPSLTNRRTSGYVAPSSAARSRTAAASPPTSSSATSRCAKWRATIRLPNARWRTSAASAQGSSRTSARRSWIASSGTSAKTRGRCFSISRTRSTEHGTRNTLFVSRVPFRQIHKAWFQAGCIEDGNNRQIRQGNPRLPAGK